MLSWDQKWLYLVSHFVEKGKVRPSRYTLQPRKKKEHLVHERTPLTGDIEHVPHSAIFASSVAKYVFKQGRLTIPPETILKESGVLLSKPYGYDPPLIASLPTENSSQEDAGGSRIQHPTSSNTFTTNDGAPEPSNNAEEWTWEKIEDERLRGLRIAESMTQLELLHHEFTAETRPALGEY